MRELTVAFDTSNYTTSSAFFDGVTGTNKSRPLDVPPGALGLRQSDALFSHVKHLPEVFEGLPVASGDIVAVGASATPRETEGSYMPCFLAGVSQGAVLAHALGVPFYEFSHQQGHIAAAAWSAGRIEMMDAPLLAWHLSGGTTELLHVRPHGASVLCEIIGGTTDVSAGQLIDRAGQILGLKFPSGRELDMFAQSAAGYDNYEPKLTGLEFSLSGVEHKMKAMIEAGKNKTEVAGFIFSSLVSVIRRVTAAALVKYGDLPVLYSGGVASSGFIRRETPDGVFSKPEFSTDNALGAAILTYRAVKANG